MIVSGIIRAADTGETLPSATVAVYRQADNQLIGGTQSDLEGRFEVGVLSGNYVRISMVGFRPEVPLLRSGMVNEINLQRANEQLPEATVTGTRSYNAIIMAVVAAALIYFITRS